MWSLRHNVLLFSASPTTTCPYHASDLFPHARHPTSIRLPVRDTLSLPLVRTFACSYLNLSIASWVQILLASYLFPRHAHRQTQPSAGAIRFWLYLQGIRFTGVPTQVLFYWRYMHIASGESLSLACGRHNRFIHVLSRHRPTSRRLLLLVLLNIKWHSAR